VSFWNLHEHAIEESSSGLILDGRTRLRLFDFSGFEAEEPYRLSPISSRIRVSRSPLLKALCERYTHELLDAGWLVGRHRPDVGRRLANGIVFDEALERLHAEAQMLDCDFGDVFSADGTTAFMAWLKGPASQGAEHGINRYVLHRVLRERQDVRAAFPDLDGRDGPAFVRWCHNFGVREMGFPRELLPAQAPSPAEPSGSRAGREWRSPDGRGPRVRRAAVRAAAGSALGVRVTGYMGHVLGLGSAARGYASALAAAGVPVSTVAVGLDHLDAPVLRESGYGRHSHQDVLAEGGHAFELVCVNPDELLGYIKPLGDDYFRGRRIGVWGWEVNSIPARWARAYSFVDEIWVYSRFVAENLGAVAPVPVVALPPPVNPPDERVRSRLGVPDGFLFLFVFDYMSTIQRKNPIGLIDAFKRAFAPGEGPRLLIKTINAPLRPLHEEAILWAAEGRADIHVIDRSLPPEEKDALMAGCDCYVSLHRSEGFGLTMAEAMAIGKPVIATAYSGNVDFMNPQNSLLVDYELTRVGAGVEIYPAEAEWADPDLDQAAALMRQVYEDPERARALGARAREDIVRTLSPQTTGAAMRARLEELAARPERPSLQRFVKRLRQLT
jgi:glycosyltransferase involved in cell wall biosynthesis